MMSEITVKALSAGQWWCKRGNLIHRLLTKSTGPKPTSIKPFQSSITVTVKTESCFVVQGVMKSQAPSTKSQRNNKFQYLMTKTCLGFGILVIVICLLFVI
jgi:hypothetical protein